LKPIREQVIVITGATSGIGLVTARLAAGRCGRLVLTGRNEAALRERSQEIQGNESHGGVAAFVPADVADEEALRRVADEAVRRYGRIDTWINCAGVSTYGRVTDVPVADQRRVFDTNFWGVVHGSRIAVEQLRAHGGVLINIGSALSDRAIPLQGPYCASKHAVKAYTDALRMEVEHDGLPISVTLVKPCSIDTPFAEHARNYLKQEPKNPPPLYAPEAVAEAILSCAERPVRDVFVGAEGKLLATLGNLLPRLTDKIMERLFFTAQQTLQPARRKRQDGLYGPHASAGLRERAYGSARVSASSFYTEASLRPFVAGAVIAAAGVAAATLFGRARSSSYRSGTAPHTLESP